MALAEVIEVVAKIEGGQDVDQSQIPTADRTRPSLARQLLTTRVRHGHRR
jgi:hypothetical protein